MCVTADELILLATQCTSFIRITAPLSFRTDVGQYFNFKILYKVWLCNENQQLNSIHILGNKLGVTVENKS